MEMKDAEKQKDILHKLVKAIDSIKQKYKLIKYNKANTEEVLKETLQPIVEPLQKIATDFDKNQSNESNQNIFMQTKFQTPSFERSQADLLQSTHNKRFFNLSAPKFLPSSSKVSLPSFNHSTPIKSLERVIL